MLTAALRISKLIIPLVLSSVATGCTDVDIQASEAVVHYHSVLVEPVEINRSFELGRKIVGKVQSNNHAKLGYEFGGKLLEIYVDAGDDVIKGQKIALMDSSQLVIQRKEIEARIREIKAQRKMTSRSLSRNTKLKDKGFIVQNQLDELKSQVESLKAKIDTLKVQRDSIDLKIFNSTLTSPFSGVISKRFVDAGSVVSAGEAIVMVLKNHSSEIQVGIPATLVDAINNAVTYRAQIGKVTHLAEVISIGAKVNDIAQTIPVRLSLLDDEGVVDGAFAEVIFPQQYNIEGAWLPLTALKKGVRGLWNVYILAQPDANGLYRTVKKDVQVNYFDGERVYVSGAIETGDLVVKTGLQRLESGQLVQLASKHDIRNL